MSIKRNAAMLQVFISSWLMKFLLLRLLQQQQHLLSTSPLAAPGRLCSHQLIDWKGRRGGGERRKIGDEDWDTPLFFNLTGEILQLCATLTPTTFCFPSPESKSTSFSRGSPKCSSVQQPSRENFIVQKGRDTNFSTDITLNKSNCTTATRQVKF